MKELEKLGLIAILIACLLLVTGCIYLNNPSSISSLNKPPGTDDTQTTPSAVQGNTGVEGQANADAGGQDNANVEGQGNVGVEGQEGESIEGQDNANGVVGQSGTEGAKVIIVDEGEKKGDASAGEYIDASLGGVFKAGDSVEFLGVKGTITSGNLENNKVVGGPPFQIDNEAGPALVYASTDSTHGFAELFHYPQRGSGEGEEDLYINGELIMTVKHTPNISFNAYVLIACEPDKYPDLTQSVITRYKNCS